MLRRFFIIFGIYTGIFCGGNFAYANIASSAYVGQYFRQQCKNPALKLPENIKGPGIASQKYVFSLIDWWNDYQTKHAASLTQDKIVSSDYLPGTMNMLTQSYYCCMADNVFPNEATGVCQSCGEWVRASNIVEACGKEGTYRVGDSCKSCPAGHTCAEGTAGKMLTIFCSADGYGLFERGCQPCLGGYMCPENVELPEFCGVGNYCKNNEKTECPTCYLPAMWFQPTRAVCADSRPSGIPFAESTITKTTNAACDDDGEYRKNGTCASCEAGYSCAAGTSGRMLKLFCADAGEAIFSAVCTSCLNGYVCPAGVEYPEHCGAGNYCTGGERTPCPDGKCLLKNLWYVPEREACATSTQSSEFTAAATITRTQNLVACDDADEYRNIKACKTCPNGYDCPAGTAGKMVQISCMADGMAFFDKVCQSCRDGYVCPATSEVPEVCGIGNYCAASVRTPCDATDDMTPEQRCPFANMWFQPNKRVCRDTVLWVAKNGSGECLDANEYRSGTTCKTCPSGYDCPAGTSGRIPQI